MQLKYNADRELTCYTNYDGQEWVAVCLDFNLVVQGKTREEARAQLDSIVKNYIFDAMPGQDEKYNDKLLACKTPMFEWIKYYWGCLLQKNKTHV